MDYLKISSAFTQYLSDNEESRVFVKAVNDLARNLKRQVIAKGVETELMVKLLKEAGALYAQGHYFQAAAPLGTAIPAPDRKSSRG